MKKDIGVKPYLFPMPVLIISTYCEDGSNDSMNAEWGAICDYSNIALYLSESHKTVSNIMKCKAFTVAVANEKNLISADYVGLVSKNNDNKKMERSGFTLTKSNKVDAPVIEELPLTLECKLDYIDGKAGCIYGEIVNILADEDIFQMEKLILRS